MSGTNRMGYARILDRAAPSCCWLTADFTDTTIAMVVAAFAVSTGERIVRGDGAILGSSERSIGARVTMASGVQNQRYEQLREREFGGVLTDAERAELADIHRSLDIHRCLAHARGKKGMTGMVGVTRRCAAAVSCGHTSWCAPG